MVSIEASGHCAAKQVSYYQQYRLEGEENNDVIHIFTLHEFHPHLLNETYNVFKMSSILYKLRTAPWHF